MLLTQNRNFRLLWFASAISNLGDGISALAFPWLASLLTRDPVLIGAVAAAGRLPWLVFTIPAGVITDAYDRRRLMVGADVFRLVLTLAVVALIVAAPAVPLPVAVNPLPMIATLAGIAFLLGAAEVLRDNAAQTVLPSIVAQGDLETANGQLWTVENIMGRFIGPPLAGLLITLAVPVPFLTDAATFAVAAVLVWAITLAPRTRVAPTTGVFGQMREGAVWLWRMPYLLYLAIFLGALNLLSTMAMTLMVLVGQEIYGLNAAQFGLLLTTAAAGGVLGGVFGPGLTRRIGGSVAVPLAVLIMVVEPAVVALNGPLILLGLGMFLVGFGGVTYNVVTVSYRQRLIPDDLLGRVNSLYRFFAWGGIPIGAILAGLMVNALSPDLGRDAALRAPYALVGCATLGLAVLSALTMRFPRT